MKFKIVFILSIIFPFVANAQTDLTPQIPVDEEGNIRYAEVFQQEGDAQDLFKRCVKWINTSYKNPTTVTPTRDMVNKKIVIRHQFEMEGAGLVMYDMTIRFKDGRYRAEVTNFVLKTASRFPAENWLPEGSNPSPENLQQLDKFATELLDSLKEGMKPEKEYEEEEW